MIRLCEGCGEPFVPARSYHRACWDCWREQRDEQIARDAYVAGYAAGLAMPAAPVPSRLDAELLRDAIALCHPDRHPALRSEQANRTTAGLLDLLQEARTAPGRRAA